MNKFNLLIITAGALFGAPASAVAAEWVKLGTGLYTDVVISSIFKTKSATLSVEFEQSVDDPNTYRIQYPYANWHDKRADDSMWYNSEKATPMVFHIVNDKYAWFEEFNTGLYIDTADEYGPIVGEVSVCLAAQDLIKDYGVATVLSSAPLAFCRFNDGTFTLTTNYALSGYEYPNVRIDVAGEPIWRGNYNGAFCTQLPDAPDLDPSVKWTTLEGKGKFTDAFSALFAYQDEPRYPTFDVEIQQNVAEQTVFRVVNPYADWQNPYSAYDIACDNSTNHYLIIRTFPDYDLACIDFFDTGLKVEGLGPFGVQSQGYFFYYDYASTFGWYLEEVVEEFPYMFGEFKDGVFSCPAYYQEEYSGQMMDFPMFTGWVGCYKECLENDELYVVNKQGNFKVVFPGAVDDDDDTNSIVPVPDTTDYESPAEYFTIQGLRVPRPTAPGIYIEARPGLPARKIIVHSF